MSTAMTSWMLYTSVIGLVLGVAAHAAESSARQVGGPTRWVWLGALLGSVLVPLVTMLGVSAWLRPATPLPEAGLIVLPPLVVGGEAALGGYSPDAWLLAGWAAASLLLGAYVLLSLLRLLRLRRHWRRAEVGGVPVLLTANVGPAALGGSILLPEWALAVDERMRRLMLLHEEEHVRAHDPALLLAALLVVIALPWNVALWWQLQRLRLAIELDCDARVLRREPDAQLYGTLLLEVGRRIGGSRLVVAFSEPRVFLERRIRAVVGVVEPSRRRALALALTASLLVVLAVCAGDPLRPVAVDDAIAPVQPPAMPRDTEAGVVTDADARRAGELVERPTFTPHTRAPELMNRSEVMAALREHYPPLLRDAGVGGNPTVWFFIDESGRVVRTMLNRSSGYAALDSAAMRVARTLSFSPAYNRDAPTPVWISIPIVFQARGDGARTDAEAARPERAERAAPQLRDAIRLREAPLTAPRADAAREAGGEPHFTPMTVAPELRNRDEVSAALARSYPPLLRDAGIGGQPTVWISIDEGGRITRLQLNQSSGYPALDAAALEVASIMQFAPAMNRDGPVPVWVSIPVVFQAR